MKHQCEVCLSTDVDSFKAFSDEGGYGFVCKENHFNYVEVVKRGRRLN